MRTISSVSVSNYIFVVLLWFNARLFDMPLTKNLYILEEWVRRIEVNNGEYSLFYGVENWLLFRITCGTKRLNPLFGLHEASEVLNKYVMGVWSDNFTAAFFVSFIVTVSAPAIEGIQNKVICLYFGTTSSVNVTSMCSANLYDISRRKPSRRFLNLK